MLHNGKSQFSYKTYKSMNASSMWEELASRSDGFLDFTWFEHSHKGLLSNLPDRSNSASSLHILGRVRIGGLRVCLKVRNANLTSPAKNVAFLGKFSVLMCIKQPNQPSHLSAILALWQWSRVGVVCRNITPSWSHASIPLRWDFRHEAAYGFASFSHIDISKGSSEADSSKHLMEPGEKVFSVSLVLASIDAAGIGG